MNPTIHQKLITHGHPNRPGTKREGLLALVVHYTANFDPKSNDLANASYFGRPYERNIYLYTDPKTGRTEKRTGPIEAGSFGRGPGKFGIPFRYGSTQRICDQDSVTICIPDDEISWAVGDRALSWEPVYRGQTKLAKEVFGNRQNYLTLNWEICCNDIIKNSLDDWEAACAVTRWDMAMFIRENNLMPIFDRRRPDVGKREILVLRHFDLTGKICPEPLVTGEKGQREWTRFGIELFKLL